MEQQVALEQSIEEGTLTKAKVIGLCATQLKSFLKQYGDLTEQSLVALGDEDLGNLNRVHQAFKPVFRKIQSLKVSSSSTLERVPEHELEAVKSLMIDIMSQAFELDVPLKVDASTGTNWLELKD